MKNSLATVADRIVMMKSSVIVLALLPASVFSAADLPPWPPNGPSLAGYCLAGSRYDEKSFGGLGKSANDPKKLDSNKNGEEGKLSLVALPREAVPFRNANRGFRLLLVNRTDAEIALPAADSLLAIVCEALDRDGDWKPIEFMPNKFCGNSFHRVFLPGRHFWEFAAPVYSGEYRTLLRYSLMRGEKEEPIYSNEFVGSINPRLFDDPSLPIHLTAPKGLLKPPASTLKRALESIGK